MPRPYLITEADTLRLDFFYQEYERRYARKAPCNYKELMAIEAMLQWSEKSERDTTAMLYMLDRVGQSSWRGQTNLVPYFPELPRNK